MSLITRARGAHPFGITWLSRMDGEHRDMLMDFGVLRLKKGDSYADDSKLEKAFLLVYGGARLDFTGGSYEAYRKNCFDEPPTALHGDRSVSVTVTALTDDVEINILRTDNDHLFGAKLYLPKDTPDEYRGKGLMRETSTRIVRTIFDHKNAPYAHLVLGEVIGFPGKWSSYPPHHHPQPEIYYYKTNPEGGFGYAEVGENVLKVRGNDTVFIAPGLTHPHCTPPGYALWYLWAIRHLPDQPYITPTFLPEYLWVQDENARYWGDDA